MIATNVLRLAINRIRVLKAHEKAQLEEIVDSESFFLALNSSLLSQITGRRISPLDERPDMLLERAKRDQQVMLSRGITAISIYERRYPAALREIFDPPYLLYVRGRYPEEQAVPAVAIVGTREPSAPASRAARELGFELASAGFLVVSGLARGIDVAAHQGALRGGITGAVLASGVDAVYPVSHKSVAAQILDRGGFLMSEYAPGVPPVKYHFPARNRIISGLARGVVVIQAPTRSGALITADYALDQGRDLFVHRAGLDGAVGAGSADLAADGAMIIEEASDIALEWGIEIARDREVAGAVAKPTGAADASQARRAQVAAVRTELARAERGHRGGGSR
ncbi:MAG: DNA-processing protein DprA [Spirochaetota bacterium]